MTYIQLTTCPICASGDVTDNAVTGCAPRFQVDLAPDFPIWAGALAIYSRCNACRVMYQNPRMDDEQVGRYYADGIYRATLNLSPDRMDADEAYRAQVDAKIIRDEIGGDIYKHLDIGASRGYLLQAVGASEKVAIEPTPSRVLFREITVLPSLDDNGLYLYTLITLIHSLEHEPHPVEYLRQAADLLTHDGRLVVEVPSNQSPGGPYRLAHLYHWQGLAEFETTARLAGLRVVKHLTTPHNFFILERAT